LNRWAAQFQNHPIHTTLNHIHEFASTHIKDVDANDQIEKRRLIKIIIAYKTNLSELDPEIIPFNQLDSLNKNLNAHVLNQVVSYKNSGNTVHLQADTPLDL